MCHSLDRNPIPAIKLLVFLKKLCKFNKFDHIQQFFYGSSFHSEAAFRLALYGKAGSASIPKAFSLAQNSPNPFNPATTISYSVPEGNSVHVRLDIFGIRGQLVRTLVDAVRDEGTYHVLWDGTDNNGHHLASGIYLYRMRSGEFVRTRKMVLLK